MADSYAAGECWKGCDCYDSRRKVGPAQCEGCRVVAVLVARVYLCARCHEDDIIRRQGAPCIGTKCYAARKECDIQRRLQHIRPADDGNGWTRDTSLQAALEAVGADAWAGRDPGQDHPMGTTLRTEQHHDPSQEAGRSTTLVSRYAVRQGPASSSRDAMAPPPGFWGHEGRGTAAQDPWGWHDDSTEDGWFIPSSQPPAHQAQAATRPQGQAEGQGGERHISRAKTTSPGEEAPGTRHNHELEEMLKSLETIKKETQRLQRMVDTYRYSQGHLG